MTLLAKRCQNCVEKKKNDSAIHLTQHTLCNEQLTRAFEVSLTLKNHLVPGEGDKKRGPLLARVKRDTCEMGYGRKIPRVATPMFAGLSIASRSIESR